MARTFRVKSVVRQLGPLVITSLVTIGILLAVTPPDDWFIVAIIAAALVVTGLIAGWLVTRTKLQISPEGITYHAIGYRVSAPWGKVAGYGKRVMGMQDVESLILRESGIELSGWMSLGYKLLPAASVVALLGGRIPYPTSLAGTDSVIPVGLFDRDWRTGEIGSMVRSYAPEAFDTRVG